MNTKPFPIGAVLTVTTGKLLCEDIGLLYELLNFMTGDSIYTHQLPRVSDECKPYLLRQFPALASVDAAGVTGDNWQDFVAEQAQAHGAQLRVEPLPAGEHYAIDPVSELAEMVHPSKILVVKPG